MMTNTIKMMSDMEMNEVVGGYLDVNGTLSESEAELARKMDEKFYEAVDITWEVLKHVLDDIF